MSEQRAFDDHQYWNRFTKEWYIRPDTVYLNHGSFGPSPFAVRQARRDWIDKLDQQPMDFYCRHFEGYLQTAREQLAEFVGTNLSDLVFVQNATYGMNVVAHSFPLESGDEVLLNNHEYGAVHRIWNRACDRVGASTKVATLPDRFESKQEVVDALLSGVTDKTKLLVISHITSATAIILPVEEICEAFAERGIPVCIDGPHAPAQIHVDISKIGCHFYTASCHKWLCAPLGSGFLFVHPDFQSVIQPPIKSWGRLLPAIPEKWDEEFTWKGTSDPSPFLCIPVAIEFMKKIGMENFRGRSRWLANYAETKLREAFETKPIADREKGWYGSMAHVPLPAGDWSQLQHELWNRLGFETPIINFEDNWYVRVSCHLYNTTGQIDALVMALQSLTGRASEVPQRVVPS